MSQKGGIDPNFEAHAPKFVDFNMMLNTDGDDPNVSGDSWFDRRAEKLETFEMPAYDPAQDDFDKENEGAQVCAVEQPAVADGASAAHDAGLVCESELVKSVLVQATSEKIADAACAKAEAGGGDAAHSSPAKSGIDYDTSESEADTVESVKKQPAAAAEGALVELAADTHTAGAAAVVKPQSDGPVQCAQVHVAPDLPHHAEEPLGVTQEEVGVAKKPPGVPVPAPRAHRTGPVLGTRVKSLASAPKSAGPVTRSQTAAVEAEHDRRPAKPRRSALPDFSSHRRSAQADQDKHTVQSASAERGRTKTVKQTATSGGNNAPMRQRAGSVSGEQPADAAPNPQHLPLHSMRRARSRSVDAADKHDDRAATAKSNTANVAKAAPSPMTVRQRQPSGDTNKWGVRLIAHKVSVTPSAKSSAKPPAVAAAVRKEAAEPAGNRQHVPMYSLRRARARSIDAHDGPAAAAAPPADKPAQAAAKVDAAKAAVRKPMRQRLPSAGDNVAQTRRAAAVAKSGDTENKPAAKATAPKPTSVHERLHRRLQQTINKQPTAEHKGTKTDNTGAKSAAHAQRGPPRGAPQFATDARLAKRAASVERHAKDDDKTDVATLKHTSTTPRPDSSASGRSQSGHAKTVWTPTKVHPFHFATDDLHKKRRSHVQPVASPPRDPPHASVAAAGVNDGRASFAAAGGGDDKAKHVPADPMSYVGGVN